MTACQQACPASAITFGNKNDKDSRVSKLRAQQRSYQVIADINTRPRTTYVAEVLNLNQELEETPMEHDRAGQGIGTKGQKAIREQGNKDGPWRPKK